MLVLREREVRKLGVNECSKSLIGLKVTGNTILLLYLFRQWLELQKLKTKIKKKVDTRASKGRRIRWRLHWECNVHILVRLCLWIGDT